MEIRGETCPRPHVQWLLLLNDFSQNRNVWGKKLSISAVLLELLYVGRRKDSHGETDRSLGMNGERRFVASPCLSVRICLCPHVSLWLSLTDLLSVCSLRLTKICQIPNLVKIEQQYLSGTFMLLTARRSILAG